MGRNRRSIKVSKAKPTLEFKDKDGLYFFKKTFDITSKEGVVTRVFLDEVPDDFDLGTFDGRCVGIKGNTFYQQYKDQFPQLVRDIAVAIQTKYTVSKASNTHIGNTFYSLQEFMSFVAKFTKPINSAADIDFYCMFDIRKSYQNLALTEDPSTVKQKYDFSKSLIVLLMGTTIGPKIFSMPHFKTDGLPPPEAYSDQVMYQIIAAVIIDCEKVLKKVKLFRTFDSTCSPQRKVRGLTYTKGCPANWTVESFAWYLVNTLKLKRPPYSVDFRKKMNTQSAEKYGKMLFGLTFTKIIASKTDEEWLDLSKWGGDPFIAKTRANATVQDYLATWRSNMSFTQLGNSRNTSYNEIAFWANKYARNIEFEELFFS